MNTNEPSENTAELSAATYLSPVGTTLPRYCFTSSGWSLMASDIEQKMTPFSASSLRNVVPTETESNPASTATPASLARSCNGTPSLASVPRSSCGTSSSALYFGTLGRPQHRRGGKECVIRCDSL